MFTKVYFTVLLVACTKAIEFESHQEGLSSIAYKDQHSTVHLHSSPVKSEGIPVYTPSVPYHNLDTSSILQEDQFSPLRDYDISSSHRYTFPIASSFHQEPATEEKQLQFAGVSFSSLNFGQSASTGGQEMKEVYAAPNVYSTAAEDERTHPKYNFAYGVKDPHTGDVHSHKESRDGDYTQGEYSLNEADGTIRTVKYTVDKHSGFNAVVERKGHASHPQPIHKKF